MLIKFFSNGRGGGAGPVGYLTARKVRAYSENRDVLRDEDGNIIMHERQPMPEVLRGSPDRTEQLIDATPFDWSYRAGVIAFTRADNPSAEQQLVVMDRFEALAFAGIEDQNRDMLWVRHTHEGRVELHFVSPRMELATGRSLNIAPPGYQKAFDALRDGLNKENGWADPMDQTRAREIVPIIEAARRGEARDLIHEWIVEQITEDAIQDRSSMVAALEGQGFQIPRAGKEYLTVLDPQTHERYRLKGELFHETWTRTASLERALEGETQARNATTDRSDNPVRSNRLDGFTDGDLQAALRQFIEQRANYNRKRYGASIERTQKRSRDDTGSYAQRYGLQGEARELSTIEVGNVVERLDSSLLGRGLDGQQHHDDERKRSSLQPDWNVSKSNTQWRGSDMGRGQADVERMQTGSQAHSLSDTGSEELNHAERFSHRQAAPRASANRIRTRIADLRRTIDQSLGKLSHSVHSLRTTLDRTDEQSNSRTRRLRELADRFTASFDRGFERIKSHVKEHWSGLRESAADFANTYFGFEAGDQGLEPARAEITPERQGVIRKAPERIMKRDTGPALSR